MNSKSFKNLTEIAIPTVKLSAIKGGWDASNPWGDGGSRPMRPTTSSATMGILVG